MFIPPPGPAERRRLVRGLSQSPRESARFLLGKILVRLKGRNTLAVRIVETEAYLGQGDPAAHASRGRTTRTAPLWGPPGTIYVYFVYGMHYCLNLAVERAGLPGCVLIRAAEPLEGSGLRPASCRGPGRLCHALGIDTRESGRRLWAPKSRLYLREGAPAGHIGVSARVGVSLATDRRLRFFDAESAAVTHPRGPFGLWGILPRRNRCGRLCFLGGARKAPPHGRRL